MLVREESSHSSYIRFKLRDQGQALVKEDVENKITYAITYPSHEYVLFLIYKLSKIIALRSMWTPGIRYRVRGNFYDDTEKNVINILRSVSLRLFTLRLDAQNPRSIDEFKKICRCFFISIKL